MMRYRYYDPACHTPPLWRPHYGSGRLILDFFLVLATGGLWLLWIIIRFLRSNTPYY